DFAVLGTDIIRHMGAKTLLPHKLTRRHYIVEYNIVAALVELHDLIGGGYDGNLVLQVGYLLLVVSSRRRRPTADQCSQHSNRDHDNVGFFHDRFSFQVFNPQWFPAAQSR